MASIGFRPALLSILLACCFSGFTSAQDRVAVGTYEYHHDDDGYIADVEVTNQGLDLTITDHEGYSETWDWHAPGGYYRFERNGEFWKLYFDERAGFENIYDFTKYKPNSDVDSTGHIKP